MAIKVHKFYSLAWLLLIAASPGAGAQRPAELEAGYPHVRTLSVQRKVDALFERGEFERALFIYRNELVPTGDKYAQYMVGYMHLMGMGTEEDPAAAFAWYRLAAERGTPEFVAVRDQMKNDLAAAEHSRADAVYRQLRRDYSDLAVLLASIKKDLRELRRRSGPDLPGVTPAMTVVNSRNGAGVRSGVGSDARLRRQLRQALVALSEIGQFPDLQTDPERADIEDLERRVQQRLESAPD